MIQTVLAYGFVVGFLALERLLRRGSSARSLETTDADRGSTRLIGASLGTAFVLPPILNLLHIGRMSSTIARWLGIGIMSLGLVMRIWSMHTLGAAYSRTLRVGESQAIVTQGPYRLIRHPGYLGTILLWSGSGPALGNWVATILLPFMMLVVYGHRIRSEEAMLRTTFGDPYIEYCRHTPRLLPFLY